MILDEPLEIVRILTDRINHVEDLLISTVMGLLVTSTFTLVAAIYTLRRKDRRAASISGKTIFYGANLFHAIIAGYYYFMLAQFYAVTVTLMPRLRELEGDFGTLWTTFQLFPVSAIAGTWANVMMLALAPLTPLAFTLIVITAIWRLEGGQSSRSDLTFRSLIVSIGCQTTLAGSLIVYPFVQFLRQTTLDV